MATTARAVCGQPGKAGSCPAFSEGWQQHLSLRPPPLPPPPASPAQPHRLSCLPLLPTPSSHGASISRVPLGKAGSGSQASARSWFLGPRALPGMPREIPARESPSGTLAAAQSSAVGLCRVMAAGGPRGRAFPPSRSCAGTLAKVPRAAGSEAEVRQHLRHACAPLSAIPL